MAASYEDHFWRSLLWTLSWLCQTIQWYKRPLPAFFFPFFFIFNCLNQFYGKAQSWLVMFLHWLFNLLYQILVSAETAKQRRGSSLFLFKDLPSHSLTTCLALFMTVGATETHLVSVCLSRGVFFSSFFFLFSFKYMTSLNVQMEILISCCQTGGWCVLPKNFSVCLFFVNL